MLAALLWIMAAAGCGKADGEPAAEAREMLERLRERAENAASMSGRLEAELAADCGIGEAEAVFDVSLSQRVEMVRETRTVHMTGSVAMSLSGIAVGTETYLTEEDGEAVSYTRTDGGWIRRETEGQDAGLTLPDVAELMLKASDTLSVQDTEDEAGAPLRRIDGEIRGTDVLEAGIAVGTLFETGETDKTDWTAKVSLYVRPGEAVPEKAVLDLTEGFSARLRAEAAGLGYDRAELTCFVITMSDYSFDTVEEIAVPDEVRASAAGSDG